MYAPITTNITNLITPQNVNQWYKIDSVSNTVKVGGSASSLTATVYGDKSVANPDIEITTSNTITNIPDTLKGDNTKTTLNIDTYSLKNKSPLFTSTNNINFHILTTKTDTIPGTVRLNRKYNYTLSKYFQEAICPNTCNNNAIYYFPKLTSSNCKNYIWSGCKVTQSNFQVGSGYYRVGNSGIKTKDNVYGWSFDNWSKKTSNLNNAICSSTCENRLRNYYGQKLLYNNASAIKTTKKLSRYQMHGNQKASRGTFSTVSGYYNKLWTDATKNYFTKWETYFKNIGYDPITNKGIRFTRAELSGSNIDEGKYEENNYTTTFKYPQNLTTGSKYLNHIIYVSINTPFSKGENGKNIFAFEQFGDKIIPVGFLANDVNSPLKFDVITRNPETFKIEKVNYYNGTEKRPLTFCEAMSYTGEEFSQYCGCRWFGSGVLVTAPNQKGNPTYYREDGGGYPERIKLCNNNFGCIIRPVKPSSSGWF